MNENKYYVFGTDWEGMELEDVERMNYDGMFDTYEEAQDFADYLWEEMMGPDELVYIYHNGELKEV